MLKHVLAADVVVTIPNGSVWSGIGGIMSVQIKGVGTIGGIDQGLDTVGVITATTFKGDVTGNGNRKYKWRYSRWIYRNFYR